VWNFFTGTAVWTNEIMWVLHPCNRERPLPKATEAKLNGFAWLALGLPAFLAGKIQDEYGKERRSESPAQGQ